MPTLQKTKISRNWLTSCSIRQLNFCTEGSEGSCSQRKGAWEWELEGGKQVGLLGGHGAIRLAETLGREQPWWLHHRAGSPFFPLSTESKAGMGLASNDCSAVLHRISNMKSGHSVPSLAPLQHPAPTVGMNLFPHQASWPSRLLLPSSHHLQLGKKQHIITQ